FVNEADSYHDFVQGMLRSNHPRESVPAYLICDRSFIADFGIGLVHPGTRVLRRFIAAGYLVEDASIPALADRLGIDREPLSLTVERYNAFAATGTDEQFGRGDSVLNRFNGDAANKPNPCLRPVGPGPCYAVRVWPADLASSAGLRTDTRGRVLRSGGERPL